MGIIWFIVGLLLGAVVVTWIKPQIDDNRADEYKLIEIEDPKEYFCPDCKTFRGKNGIHESIVSDRDSIWGFKVQRMCLCCGNKNVVEWQDYLKDLAISGRLGCGCVEQTTEEVE